jgi:hypothetical protein
MHRAADQFQDEVEEFDYDAEFSSDLRYRLAGEKARNDGDALDGFGMARSGSSYQAAKSQGSRPVSIEANAAADHTFTWPPPACLRPGPGSS